MVPGVAKDLSAFIFNNMILQNTGNFSLSDTASHLRRPALSAALCDNIIYQ